MWLLPSRGRHQLCQDALDAAVEAGMTTPGIVIVDSRIDCYRPLRLPDDWLAIRAPLDMADTMRLVFDSWPHLDWYGWLADDLRPRTPGWDRALIAAAGRWGMADCNDLWLTEIKDTVSGSLCGAFVWGGDLLRATGWWALPGVRQAGIDDAWIQLHQHGAVRRVHVTDVIVEHLQYRNGKRAVDATDNHVRDGEGYIEADRARYAAWLGSDEFGETAARIMGAQS